MFKDPSPSPLASALAIVAATGDTRGSLGIAPSVEFQSNKQEESFQWSNMHRKTYQVPANPSTLQTNSVLNRSHHHRAGVSNDERKPCILHMRWDVEWQGDVRLSGSCTCHLLHHNSRCEEKQSHQSQAVNSIKFHFIREARCHTIHERAERTDRYVVHWSKDIARWRTWGL